jgi:hypothetical protein
MRIKEQIIEELDENNEITFADGFDDALIGASYIDSQPRAVYSFMLGLEVLMEKHNMSEEEAIDYLHFNTMLKGEKYPIWVMDYYINSKI